MVNLWAGRKKLIALAVVICLCLGGGLWWWTSRDDVRTVPSCDELAEALPGALAGLWTLTDTEVNRARVTYLVGCEFSFESADGVYQGRVNVDLSGVGDESKLRKDVKEAPCLGQPVNYPSGSKYLEMRSCINEVNETAFVDVYVASGERYGSGYSSFSSSEAPYEQVAEYAVASTYRIVDRAMTLEAGE